jgi:hypothetical protein
MTRNGLDILHLLAMTRVIDDQKLANTSQTTLHLHAQTASLFLPLIMSLGLVAADVRGVNAFVR